MRSAKNTPIRHIYMARLDRLTHQGLCLLLAMAVVLSSFISVAYTQTAQANQVRIKDIVDFEGVRDNLLIGYGLVVGLNGTGDNLNNNPFTQQSLIGMLERLSVNVRDQSMKTQNVAAVMVTATLPPFANQGSRIDVSVAALGNASSLQGGTLLVTPLLGADGEVYAVAQGSIAVAGFSAGGQAATVTQNTPTAGRIAAGAIIEREVNFALNEMQSLRLSLRNPDFTTARRIQDAVNNKFQFQVARATDPSTVILQRSPDMQGDMFNLITDIEQLRVVPDVVAKVVIDERSGVIVMGQNVRISTIALAQGNLTIRVGETPLVSQPQPFAQQGQTAIVPRTNVDVDDSSDKRIAVLREGITLQELVESLNALGVGPRDIITILQSIKASGALQAEIQVM